MRVDLGGNRGWLEEPAAKSICRIDRALGHKAQITEAGRTYERQMEHWLTYQRYGKPIALHPDTPSIHQKGAAIDSDELQRHLNLMYDHGWRRTVIRNGVLVEPWHFEYFPQYDNHINEVIILEQTPDGVWHFEEDELNATQAGQLANIYAAIFTGGPSMQDGGRSISQTLADIASGKRPTVQRETNVPWIQEIADIKTLALREALSTLSPEEVKSIAKAVVEELIERGIEVPKA